MKYTYESVLESLEDDHIKDGPHDEPCRAGYIIDFMRSHAHNSLNQLERRDLDILRRDLVTLSEEGVYTHYGAVEVLNKILGRSHFKAEYWGTDD